MLKHYQAVHALLKTALWGQERYPLCLEEDTDWNAVSKELTDQSVDALVMDVLPTVPNLAPELLRGLMIKASRRMTYWHLVMREQEAVISLFREAQIPFVLLKGSAAAIYYPQPEYRTMGDIDILVRREDFPRAYQLMEENGFVLFADWGTRDAAMKKNDVIFELHRHYAVMDDRATGQILDDWILSEIDCLQTEKIGDYTFPVLSAMTNGLVLLAHIDQHMTGGLGLRQIIDWMLFVDQMLDDEGWQAFVPRVRELGMEKLAVTVTRMCQMYLGLREEGITWCSGAKESVCTRLMEVTMERGNFGNKNAESTSTVRAVRKIKGIPSLFIRLHERGCYNWKLVKKYPFLKPFAWIYQLFRYMIKGFSRKNPIKSLREDIRRSKQEDELWDELDLARRYM